MIILVQVYFIQAYLKSYSRHRFHLLRLSCSHQKASQKAIHTQITSFYWLTHSFAGNFKCDGWTIQPAKAQLGTDSCKFLDTKSGMAISLDEAITTAIKNLPIPHCKKDVCTFLGLAGYYKRFIDHYRSKSAPLSDLTKTALPDMVDWSEDCE